jgi:exodeoxyribonuclease V gamma subunit
LPSLRGVPFRVICLLGLDDGVLPNTARAPEFDLLAAFPRLGDRQRRDDDRNLFLDYLLAARDHFVVAYTGRSIRDNAIKPPAAPVDELLDYLGAALAGASASPDDIARARAGFVVEHPLQPYATEYLDGKGALFTYDSTRAEIATALFAPARETAPTRPFFETPLPPPDEEAVSFDALLAFWSQPARALLRDRLGLNFRSARAELDDSEPFVLDWDGRDALAGRLLPILVEDAAGIDRASRIARASHELPGGALGAIWRERELSSLARLADAVRAARGEPVDAPPYFAFELPMYWPEQMPSSTQAPVGSIVLEGALPALTSLGLIVYRHASPSARDYLNAWLHHLVLCVARPVGVACSTYWIGRGPRFVFREDPDARRHLCELVSLYRAGLCAPLPFFPKTSWAWVDKGESAAFAAWQGGFDRAGEQDDPYVSTAWRGAPPRFDAYFDAVARAVFEPLRAHLDGAGEADGPAKEGT